MNRTKYESTGHRMASNDDPKGGSNLERSVDMVSKMRQIQQVKTNLVTPAAGPSLPVMMCQAYCCCSISRSKLHLVEHILTTFNRQADLTPQS
jgi:hypothetical protein